MSVERPTTRGRQVALTIVSSIIGVALLVWQVHQVGVGTIRDLLRGVGAGFIAILALSVTRFFLRSIAWTTLIAEPVSVWSALAATIAGDALGNLTPLSLIVSEPAKSMYLGRSVPAWRSLAALTAENFFYSVSVAIYIALGTAAFLATFHLDPTLLLVGVLALAGMAALLGGAAWLAWQRPAVASQLASRIPIRQVRDMVARIREFEERAYGSVGGQGGRLIRLVCFDVLFHVLSFVESWFTLWLLTGRSLPIEAFVLDTFSRISNIVFRIVPLKLGADQWGSERVAAAMSLASGIGTSLSLVRTGRVLVWAVVGMALLVRRTARRR